MLIRAEAPEDHRAIHDLTQAAFAPKPFADGFEGPLIDMLRDAGDLALSLVADEDEIIGHVAFSPAQITDAEGAWYALGPISVRADRQRQGIGRKLVEAGLTILAERGAAGCVLTGNPSIYERLGFVSDGNLHHDGTEDRYVLWRRLHGAAPRGFVTFAPAFDPANHVYVAPDVADVLALHPDVKSPTFRKLTIREQLDRQAKTLLKAHQNRDARARMHIQSWWPKAQGQTLAQIFDGAFTPSDAHTTMAREYGYAAWDDVPDAAANPTFEMALDALLDGNLVALLRLMQDAPNLIRQRSSYGHRATLLHYLGSNGVESHRQVVPINAAYMAQRLIAAGADPKATMQVYGGPQTPLALASTSAHPIAAGIADALNTALRP
ncbi:N-acetyltransferase [Cognatiyoonia sp. IB215446]|uniref:GNAT family N-acetyltransferase n=1 Tax=Cognatiyoonia sp. IB215446 TaxID=3097355 RepID=UPI002A1346C6|nr:N-acetyltransferase [Cognatiyoonia sp. IB215446]MDX8349250.1 N-acetyltransferase [Cognatiyoonia sp. IB215446]